MFERLADWIEDRTGYRGAARAIFDGEIPGGAHWRYVFGSALLSTFLIQLATGIFLVSSYSPSATTAWGSVFYINNVMAFGWFLRGIHHFGSQAMIVLLAMHLTQVILSGAYRAPREMNYWFGMGLMLVTLGLGLTGYLLPWDQKGFWATNVATEIAGGTPVLGSYIKKVALGGSDYGNQTLTRFFSLYVFVLPLSLIGLVVVHIYLLRRHGLTPPKNTRGIVGRHWPAQALRDSIAALVVMGVLVALVLANGGANLDAPADPSGQYPARPEWYFLFLYQFLKKLPGKYEALGALGGPGAIMTILFLLPVLDKVFPRRLAHFFACTFLFALLGGAGYLTVDALKDDHYDKKFQEDRHQADLARERSILLAKEQGISPRGAAYLLPEDPLYTGRKLVASQCLSCHVMKGVTKTPTGGDLATGAAQVAPDLYRTTSRNWVRGLLEDPKSATYFGKVPGCDGMATWKKSSKLKGAELDAVADFLATFSTIPSDVPPEEWVQDSKIAKHAGFEPFVKECLECHLVGTPGLLTGKDQDVIQDAPNLFAYGSTQWLRRMIRRPGAPDLYGWLPKEQQMPSFAGQLTDSDLDTIVRYLRGDYLGVEPAPAEMFAKPGR